VWILRRERVVLASAHAGGKPKLSNRDRRRIQRFREAEKQRGGAPTAGFVQRKLGITSVSERTVQRAITADGDKRALLASGRMLATRRTDPRVSECVESMTGTA